MALLVNIQELEDHDVSLEGTVPADELSIDIGDRAIQPTQSLKYALEFQLMSDAILARGRLEYDLNCVCVRCMEPFEFPLRFDDWICHVPTEGEEAAPLVKGCVDLTPYIREDMLLAFPQHPLCRENCPGLPTKDSKKSEESLDRDDSSSPWDRLNQLKL